MSLDVDLILDGNCVFSYNITHNLGHMARAVDLYEYLWRPEELGIEKASQLGPILYDGLARFISNESQCRHRSPENGWGTYEGLVKFVSEYLVACAKYPDAIIEVSR